MYEGVRVKRAELLEVQIGIRTLRACLENPIWLQRWILVDHDIRDIALFTDGEVLFARMHLKQNSRLH